MIAAFEGFRADRYLDVAGVPTIGYGETRSDIVAKGRISEGFARRLLRQRIDNDFAPAVDRSLTREPNQHQFDAMVSLAYNIGTGGFADSTVAREFNRGNARKAGQAFLLWVKAGGRTIQGLVNRRRAEVKLFFTATPPPIKHSDKERYLMRLIAQEGISERRRIRARDWLIVQQKVLGRLGREQSWTKRDRGRRFQAIRKALGIGRKR